MIEALSELDAELELLNSAIEELTDSVEGLPSSVVNLEEFVLALEQTDEELGTALVELDSEVGLLDPTVTGLSGSVDELDSRVTELESLSGTSDDVAEALNDLDTRLSKLEVNGTVAFYADLGSPGTIAIDSVVTFLEVNLNIGNAYDSETGKFTIPADGAGLYYFYVHFMVDEGEVAEFIIRHNQ